jgi:hypothetical protein
VILLKRISVVSSMYIVVSFFLFVNLFTFVFEIQCFQLFEVGGALKKVLS